MTAQPVALKEWAVICHALTEGRQAILLRKGGIAEPGGVFAMEHLRFWLWPTYLHQQESGIIETARPLLEAVVRERPAPGQVRLRLFATAETVYHADTEGQALALEGLHVWSRETVRSRFAYRSPGLFVVAVRVYRAAVEHEIAETVLQAGCKSWVTLSEPALPTEGEPVLAESAFDRVLNTLDRVFQRSVTV